MRLTFVDAHDRRQNTPTFVRTCLKKSDQPMVNAGTVGSVGAPGARATTARSLVLQYLGSGNSLPRTPKQNDGPARPPLFPKMPRIHRDFPGPPPRDENVNGRSTGRHPVRCSQTISLREMSARPPAGPEDPPGPDFSEELFFESRRLRRHFPFRAVLAPRKTLFGDARPSSKARLFRPLLGPTARGAILPPAGGYYFQRLFLFAFFDTWVPAFSTNGPLFRRMKMRTTQALQLERPPALQKAPPGALLSRLPPSSRNVRPKHRPSRKSPL